MNPIRWLVSARYRRYCRVQNKRREANWQRTVREYYLWRLSLKMLAAEASAAGDHRTARETYLLLMKLEITAQMAGII